VETSGEAIETPEEVQEETFEARETEVAEAREEAFDTRETEVAQVREGAPATPETEVAEVREEAPTTPETEVAQAREEAPATPETEVAQAREEAPATPETEVAEVQEEAPATPETGVAQVQEEASDTQETDVAEDQAAEMGELPLEDWDYQRPKRGQVRTGVILAIREQEIIVDVDAKRDGIVPYADMQRLGVEAVEELSVGDELPVYILRPEDKEGNLLVSLFQARQAKAWERAAELAESGQVWEGEVVGYNKGGLVMLFDEIRGFIPASQVPGFPHGLGQEERLQRLSDRVGEKMMVKVIEINRRNRRLILSATAAQRQWRKRQRERLLEELREGQVHKGVVSSLCSFGAFVDLGGADGLVHISELSWRRVRHPREVVSVGDEVEVYVLRLDHDRKRIGLSLKRLQPEPWALVEDKYELGQLVEGVVTNVVDFGAFAEIEEGVEGLIHVSELTETKISHPREVVKKGDLLLLRIIRIDARRKRLGLSLKRVLESEWAEWAARLAVTKEQETEAAPDEEAESPQAEAAEEATPESADETPAEAADETPAEAVGEPIAETKEEAQEESEQEPEEPQAEGKEPTTQAEEESGEAEGTPEPTASEGDGAEATDTLEELELVTAA
jgi:small subunit ribosomal protein S1